MFDAGAIVGRMILDTDKWDKAVAQVERQTKALSQKASEMGQAWLESGRQMDRLGNKLAMIGGIGLAPFALAIRNVSKENFALQNQLDEMGDAFLNVQRDLVNHLIPWLDKLTVSIKSMCDGFNNLNPLIKEFVVNFVITASVLTIALGLMLKTIGVWKILIGVIFKASSAMLTFTLANPWVAIVVGITAATIAIVKFKDELKSFPLAGFLSVGDEIAKKIGEKFKGLSNAIRTTFVDGFKGVGETLASLVMGALARLFQALSQIGLLPQELKEKFAGMALNFATQANQMKQDAQTNFQGIGAAWKNLIDGANKDTSLIPSVWQQVVAGMQKGIHDLQKEYNNWGEFAKNKTMEIAKSMESIFSTYFFNLMTGQFQSFKETMASLGRAILQMIADIIARMMIALAIKAVLAPMTGGLSMLIPGFADGTEEVPGPGLYRLHGGEKVTPKYDASGGSSGTIQVTIHNLITPEVVASAMSGKEGRGVIVNTINADSLRNGVTRREVTRR